MFKWAEIAQSTSPFRFKILSEILNEKGFKNEIHYFQVQPTEFESTLKNIIHDFESIRLGSPYGANVLKYFENQTALLKQINAADTIIQKSPEDWQLLATNMEAFKKIIRKYGSQLRLDSSALIVGSGAAARFAIYALIEIGYKHIKISNQFPEQAKQLIEELKTRVFKINFEFVPEDELVLLPGTNAVLINTTPSVDSNRILKELYYFNFLRPDGLVIDFTFLPLNTTLIREAEQIGIKAVRGYEIFAWSDIQWCKICLNADISYEEYCQRQLQASSQWELENPTVHQSSFTEGTRF